MIRTPASDSPLQEKDPIQLLARIVDKDKAAFGLFYDLLAPKVFGFILRIVRTRSDAEEILQDTFYYAWEKAANYDRAKSSPLSWLFTIARSRSIDRLRSLKRQPQPAEVADDPDRAPLEIEDPRSGLDIAHRDAEEVLKKRLQALSEIQRETLELVYFQGLTQSEIAQKLGLPLGTVKTRIRDGLGQLKKIFADDRTEQYR